MYGFPQAVLLVFAKAPEAGRVKTRLLSVLSAQDAARLQEELTQDTLRRMTARPLCALQLHCSPGIEHPFFEALGERYSIDRYAQQGTDLGARMLAAARTQLQHYEWVILIGCDCPPLDLDTVEQVCVVMAEGADAVLVPAEDGGYVLLALRRAQPSLFQEIDWGSDRVLAQTRAALQRLGWCWRELPTLWDLDRPEDLARYRGALARVTPPPLVGVD